jgi:hypothetical protein
MWNTGCANNSYLVYRLSLATSSFIVSTFCWFPSSSALDSLPDSLKEKLLLDGQRKGKLEDLHNSVQGISSDGALRLFHESILQDNPPPEENRLQTVPNDLLLLLNECPDVQVPEELARVP